MKTRHCPHFASCSSPSHLIVVIRVIRPSRPPSFLPHPPCLCSSQTYHRTEIAPDQKQRYISRFQQVQQQGVSATLMAAAAAAAGGGAAPTAATAGAASGATAGAPSLSAFPLLPQAQSATGEQIEEQFGSFQLCGRFMPERCPTGLLHTVCTAWQQQRLQRPQRIQVRLYNSEVPVASADVVLFSCLLSPWQERNWGMPLHQMASPLALTAVASQRARQICRLVGWQGGSWGPGCPVDPRSRQGQQRRGARATAAGGSGGGEKRGQGCRSASTRANAAEGWGYRRPTTRECSQDLCSARTLVRHQLVTCVLGLVVGV